ncbi:hypothetical protein [Arsenicitalea aurantiaca]|nr:hypothetical protein [Arsenicitalea aurantiaca]
MRLSIALAALMLATPALAQDLPLLNQIEMFEAAKGDGLTGVARKTLPVDARPAVEGEIVVSIIPGEGVETQSPPASAGDWVVRNRCFENVEDNPEILVRAARFPERYGPAQSEPDDGGYSEFHPTGVEMEYFIVTEETGEFQFTAPWGEPMVARPGDAIVQIPNDPDDTYRIARVEFDCTYEVVEPAAE